MPDLLARLIRRLLPSSDDRAGTAIPHLLITEVTRMQRGFVCVAGIDLDTGRRVRPIVTGQLPAELLARGGGPFDVRAVVDLEMTWPRPSPPETEDHLFDVRHARMAVTMGGPEFIARLDRACVDPNSPAFFPPGLRERGPARVLPVHQGSMSLAIVCADGDLDLYVDPRGAVRVQWGDGLDLSVTDARLYGPELRVAERRVVDRARALMRDGRAYLSLGLTRAWQKPGEDAPYHWLQVNALHLAAAPEWNLITPL